MFNFDKIAKQLSRLKVTPSEAIIVGSGILAALGIRPSNDIDLMVSEETFARVAGQGYPVAQYADGSGQLIIDDTELMYSWLKHTFDDIKPNAVCIHGLWFMSLQDLRTMKVHHNRPKDHRDIKLIDEYLSEH